jgi:FkbM family methyltransferase
MKERIIAKLSSTIGFSPKAKAIKSTINFKADAISRTSLQGAILQAKKIGFYPRTVIDVGAASGSITETIAAIYPDAVFLMIEPLMEFTTDLKAVMHRTTNARIISAAASDRNGTITLNVHEDLVGSSSYKEIEGLTEGSNVDGIERIVPSITLNAVCKREETKGPYLIKVDVQGAEIDVLKGASDILSETEFIILEVSLFKFFIGGPELIEVIIFMKEQGFVCYDIYGLIYRLLDNALSQVDMAFVKESGMFRRNHSYATKQQREIQNAQMRRVR